MSVVRYIVLAGLVALLVLVACRSSPPAPPERTDPSATVVHAVHAVEQVTWSGRGCTAAGWHAQIEPIRQPDSRMLIEIRERGAAADDPDGCVVCHGGTLDAKTAAEAHRGAPAKIAASGGGPLSTRARF